MWKIKMERSAISLEMSAAVAKNNFKIVYERVHE
jgi:hypothetical protein